MEKARPKSEGRNVSGARVKGRLAGATGASCLDNPYDGIVVNKNNTAIADSLSDAWAQGWEEGSAQRRKMKELANASTT